MACRSSGAMPLPQQMMTYCQLDPYTLQTYVSEIWMLSVQENAFENIVCKFSSFSPYINDFDSIQPALMVNDRTLPLTHRPKGRQGDCPGWHWGRWSLAVSLEMLSGNHIHVYTIAKWRHNEQPGVSSHRRLDCLYSRLFRLTSKKIWKPALLALCEGNPPVTGGSPHKRQVMRKPFPFDDPIMPCRNPSQTASNSAHWRLTLANSPGDTAEY